MNSKKVLGCVTQVLLICLVSFALPTYAVDEVLFVGGAPLQNYQTSIIVRVLEEAFQRNNITFTAKHFPSARSLAMSNSGEADGELHRVYEFHEITNNKYPNLIRIESQMLTVAITLFAVKTDITVKTWDDLKPYTVAYKRGRKNFETGLNKVLPAEQILAMDTDEDALRMVVRGRADLAIANAPEILVIISNNAELTGLVQAGQLSQAKIYSYIHKKHEALAPAIAKTIDDMKQDGTFQQIVDAVSEEKGVEPFVVE
jgi:polar amino acid transport system substrate-binding protein